MRLNGADYQWISSKDAYIVEDLLEQEQKDLSPVKDYWAVLRDGRVWLLGFQLFCWSIGLYGFLALSENLTNPAFCRVPS